MDKNNITRNDVEKIMLAIGESIAESLEVEEQEVAREKLQKLFVDMNNRKKSKIIRREYFDMQSFNKENEGYEDYILFVSTLLEDEFKDERNKYFEMLYKRYNNFDDYFINYDQYYIKDVNPKENIINEFYSKRNLDLLLIAAPNIEEHLLKSKKKSELSIFRELKSKNPMMALELLVSHKKTMNKVFKKEMYDRFRSEISKKKLSNMDFTILSFIKENNQDFKDEILNGIYIRKKVTPLGTLPANKLIKETKSCIDAYEEEYIISENKTSLNDIEKLKNNFGEDIINVASSKGSFVSRIKKIVSKGTKPLIALLVTTCMYLMPTNFNLIHADKIVTQLNYQSEVYNDTVEEKTAIKYLNYEIKDGDTLYKIARFHLESRKENYNEKEVKELVEQLITDNKDLQENPSLIKKGKNLRIRKYE